MSVTLNVTGMSCGHCQTAVTKALSKVPGVTEATVDLAGGTAVVEGQNIDEKALVEAIVDEGYGAAVIDAGHGPTTVHSR